MVPVENHQKNAPKEAGLATQEDRVEAGTESDRREIVLVRKAVASTGKRNRPWGARSRKPRNKVKGSVEGKRKDEQKLKVSRSEEGGVGKGCRCRVYPSL